MTGLLFYGMAYVVMGLIVTLFLRFVGLPDPSHLHDSECWVTDKGGYWDQSHYTCKPRLGGSPFQLVYWVMWTVTWPFVILGIAASAILWGTQKVLSVRV